MKRLQRVRRSTLREAVLEQLKQYIVEEGLQPGDALPSERELEEQLGVSRTVLREALKGLESIGLVESRPGSGMVLLDLTHRGLRDFVRLQLGLSRTSVFYVWETRLVLEMSVVPLVVERATEEDYLRLESISQSMWEVVNDGGLGLEEDQEFHRNIIAATHNPVLTGFSEVIAEFFTQVHEHALAEGLEVRRIAAEEHDRLLELLRGGRVQDAQELLRTHLERPEKQGLVLRPTDEETAVTG